MEHTNINNDVKISNSSFYYKEYFKEWYNLPCVYALDIAMEKYFCNLLHFPLDRLIYASNDFCFREREKKNGGQLNLPFMNYYLTGYSDTDREWWNNYAQSYAVMDVSNQSYYSNLGTQLKLTPVKAEYEATVFFNQRKDAEFAYHQLVQDEANETMVSFELESSVLDENGDPNILLNNGIVYLEIEFNPTYNETDWLQQNNIWTVQANFNVDTFMIYGNSDNDFHIAKEVELEFITSKHRKDLSEGNGLVEYFELLN